MTDEEALNVKLMRDGYAKWHKSEADSVEYWMNLLAEDVQWRSLGAAAAGAEFAQPCCSKSNVLRYFQQMGEQWELLTYEIDEYVAQGDRVVALGRCSHRNRQTGKVLETPKADVLRFRGGKVVDFMEFYDTALANAAMH